MHEELIAETGGSAGVRDEGRAARVSGVQHGILCNRYIFKYLSNCTKDDTFKVIYEFYVMFVDNSRFTLNLLPECTVSRWR